MTYTAGSTIEAADYNGFVSNGATNINDIWSTGATDKGWGQSVMVNVNALSSVTALRWSNLVNNLATMGSQTGTTLTSRTAPVAGNTISILPSVATDITSLNTNRGNAVASGAQYSTKTGLNYESGSSDGTWTLTFTNTITFPSAAAARYFWNAGGLVKIQVSKTSTGNIGDPEWNDLASTLCGAIFISGRVNGATQSIAGANYSGVKQVGGTGTPTTLATATGWYNLTAGAGATTVYKQFADTSPYTSNYIQHTLAKGAGSDTLIVSTTWVNAEADAISGGTAPSGATPGTAPCTILSYYPPSTTYLTNSWGTPTIACTVDFG